MYKIERTDFYPIEGDKDFKVILKPMSFDDYSIIQIEVLKTSPSGGPSDGEDLKKMMGLQMFVAKLFESCVVKVEGCSYAGNPVGTWKELLSIASKKVVDAIVSEIMKGINPEEAEIKN